VKKNLGGESMTAAELEEINLECDLIDLVNRYAWPQASKIVKELLSLYVIKPKSVLAVDFSEKLRTTK
jgi:hypothetical protein